MYEVKAQRWADFDSDVFECWQSLQPTVSKLLVGESCLFKSLDLGIWTAKMCNQSARLIKTQAHTEFVANWHDHKNLVK